MSDEVTPSEATTADKVRYPRAAIVLLAIGAVLTWLSSRMTWVEINISDGLGGARMIELNGNQWASAPTVLALVLLAAIGAAMALSGWARRLLGVLVALIGAGASVPAIVLLMGSSSAERAERLAELPVRAEVVSIFWLRPAGMVSFVAAFAVFVAGGLLARRPDENAGLSSRFSRDTEEDEITSQRSIWAALDAGLDPTDVDPDTDLVDPATDEAPDAGERRDDHYSDRIPPKEVHPEKDRRR